ncbi:MAG: histidinol-phosphate transaminase [Methylotenera sp.]|nr:histidinol-phosphate transaminase [Oligoflexia bacterium]
MKSHASIKTPEYIRTLAPYVPGKPIEETQREYKLKKVVKLASNENPLGPSPKALAALKTGIRELHRYPDASAFHLKHALHKHLHVKSHELIIGNGSNEIIDMLIRTYCVAGDSIVTSEAAFIAYRICAQIHGVTTLEAPATHDLRADLPALAQVVRKNARAKMVFLANPNNPTGTYNTTSELRSFLKEISTIRGGSVLVALDYAYWEYVTAKDLPDPMALWREFPNTIVLRTFSKVYGLAGLRVGYGIAHSEIISTLEKVRQPFNMNTMALLAATAALTDQTFVKKAVQMNNEGRKFWEKALTEMGIPFWKSQGNFILIDSSRGLGKRGGDVYLSCLKRGVIFRPVSNYGLMNALRISIGTPAENRFAAKALAAELPSGAEASPSGAASRKLKQ